MSRLQRIRRILLAAALVMIVGFQLAALAGAYLVKVNVSRSIPLGLYRRAAGGHYAAFCLTRDEAQWALSAGLETLSGDCPGRIIALLKPLVYPTPEHPLVLTASGFFLNGKLLPNTAPKAKSKTGKPLGHYPFGVYTSGIWPVSTYNRDSLDARYYGPISSDQIRFHAKPLLVW
jgi:conjugative transfer signal peptidase TraF